MACGESYIVKFYLTIFNFVSIIIGCALIYLGYQILDWNVSMGVETIVTLNIRTTSWLILAIGVVVLLVSFLGFFGAYCEMPILLKTYAFLFFFIIVCECVLLFSVQKDTMNIDDTLELGMRTAIQEIQDKNHTAYLLEKFQYNLGCCGWMGEIDYPFGRIPGSCCGIDPGTVQEYVPKYCQEWDRPSEGCKDKLSVGELVSFFGTTFAALLFMIMFQFCMVLMACCLAQEIYVNNFIQSHLGRY